MITPRHDRDGFFKYYTAESAKLTLETGTRKWSSPLLFNDPFDNQFDLDFPEPSGALAAGSTQNFLAVLRSPDPIEPDRFGSETPLVEFLRQVQQNNPNLERYPIKFDHTLVRAGLGPGIHEKPQPIAKRLVDGRAQPGQDELICVRDSIRSDIGLDMSGKSSTLACPRINIL